MIGDVRARDARGGVARPAGVRSARAAALLLAWLVAFGLVPAAHAVIVYQCGNDLCRIAPDGSGRAQITSDGTGVSPYTWPSLSRDGTRMAWIRNGDLYLGSATAQPSVGPIVRSAAFDAIRPDGAQVGVLETSYFGVTGTYVKVFDATGAPVISGPQPARYSLGWAPDNSLLLPWSDAPTVGICVAVDSGGSWSCATRVAGDPAGDLNFPAVSPDGRLLAVDDGGRIAVFDYAARTLLRYLTGGPSDTTPAWSSDSASIAFQRGTSASTSEVRVVNVDGSGERLLAGGGAQTPTWGGQDGASTPNPTSGPTPQPGPPATNLVVGRAQRGTRVRGRLTVTVTGSRLGVRLTDSRGRLLGTLTRRGLRAGTVRFTVSLNRRGRSALRRAGKLKLRLKVVVTGPSGAKTTLPAVVRLRR